jgi:two-component system response regulator FixJ
MPTANNAKKHTVFIVDDDIDICQSLQWLLESVDLDVKIFDNGLNFLTTSSYIENTGCILLDIRMPEMSGLELQEQLKVRKNTLPIIFMTGHGDIEMAVRAMKAGAFDFITKPFNDQIILDQIQKAISHCQQFQSKHKENSLLQQRFVSLTKREHEILELITTGKLNKEIAHNLNISIKTVELHRSNLMKKVEANTVAELVKFYLAASE